MLPDEFGKLDLVGFDYYNSSQWRQVYSKQYLENNGNDTSTSISDSLDSVMKWATVPASTNLSGIFNISQLQLPNATQFDPSNNISVLQTLGISLNKDNWLEDYTKYSIHLGPALSRQTNDGSNVQLAVPFMVVVLICNLTKMTVMFLMLFNDHEEHLVTNGDALASFLQKPDQTTVGYCVASERSIRESLSTSDGYIAAANQEPRTWVSRKRRFRLEVGATGIKGRGSRTFAVVRVTMSVNWQSLGTSADYGIQAHWIRIRCPCCFDTKCNL